MVKNLPVLQETQVTQVQSLGWKDPLEEGMATHSSILAWRIPWTEKPGRLQSIGLQRVGHDWSDLTCTAMQTNRYEQKEKESLFPWKRNWQFLERFNSFHKCNNSWQDHCKRSYACMFTLSSCVQLFATPWTVALQAPLSMAFLRQEYWSGLPCPSSGGLPHPGIESRFNSALQADSLPLSHEKSPL